MPESASPVNKPPCVRYVTFVHIVRVEVVRCGRRQPCADGSLQRLRVSRAMQASSAHDDQDFTDAASGNWDSA